MATHSALESHYQTPCKVEIKFHMNPLVGISIVNYKTAHLVLECLDSITRDNRSRENTRIVVVDNNSGDDSASTLNQYVTEKAWQDWVEIIAADKNGGFSYGNNIAIRRLMEHDCEVVWLVNPDTQLLPGACDALLESLQNEPSAGAAGSRLEDFDGTPQIAAFNFPTPFGEFVNTSEVGFVYKFFPRAVVARPLPDKAVFVDWIAGASMMLRRDVFDRIGLMDENYFLYFEEVDYCFSIKQAGYKVMYAPDSRVIHHVGASTGISDTRKQAPRRPKYWFESRQRFFQKTYGFAPTLAADFLWVAGHLIQRFKTLIQRRPSQNPPYILRDFVYNSSFVKGRVTR